MIRRKNLLKFLALLVFAIAFDVYAFGIIAAMFESLTNNLNWIARFKESYFLKPLHVFQSVILPSTDIEKNIQYSWFKMQIVALPILGYTVIKAAIKLKLWRRGPKDMQHYGSHGTARWANKEEIQEWFLMDTQGVGIGLVNGKDAIHPISSTLTQNILVVGGTGSNKSTSEVIPIIGDAMKMGESLIINDPKGEMYDLTAAELKANGYEVYLLNFVDPKRSNQWNPLDFVHTTLDVVNLANAFISNTSNANSQSDEMWKNGEQALLTSVILYVKKHLSEEYQNMTQVLSLGLREGEQPGYLKSLFDPLPDGDEAKEMYLIFCAAEPKVRSGIAIGFATRLQLFAINEIAAMTSWSDFEMTQIPVNKMAIYLIIPDYNKTYVPIIATFHSQLFEVLYTTAHKYGGVLPRPVRMLRDEFANTGKVPSYAEKIATVRSRRIYETIFLQEIAQLETMFPNKEWETVLGNFDTLIYLGKVEKNTAKYLSEKLGTKTILVDGHSESAGRSDSETDQESFQGRELLKPDEVSRFDLSKLIVIQNGRAPVQMDKRYYFKHPVFSKFRKTSWRELPERILEKPTLYIPEPYSQHTFIAATKEDTTGLELPQIYLE